MQQLSLFKDNQNAPQIRFIRKNGRIIPIVNKKKVAQAGRLVDDRLEEMKMEVKQASFAGKSHSIDSTGKFKHHGGFTTYPDFYRQMKFKNKSDFNKIVERGSGKKYNDLVEQSIDDLKTGYDSAWGRVPPNLQFRVATKQTYDNNGVVFRRIGGKIRPLRFSKKAVSFDNNLNDHVPF